MQLLMEFFAPQIKLHEDRELMLEVLGKLSAIDRGLVKILRKERPYFSGKKPHGADQVAATVGAGSEVIETPLKNPNDAMDKLKGAVALVLKYGDSQVLAIADKAKTLGGKATGYIMLGGPKLTDVLDVEAITKEFVSPDRTVTRGKHPHTFQAVERDNEGAKFVKSLTTNDPLDATSGRIKEVMKMIFDASKANKQPVSALLVMKDVERVTKQAARKTARRGQVPLPDDNSLDQSSKSAYSKFIQQLKSDMKDRLDTLKSSRVGEKFTNIEEMLKTITEKGFMDKLKFMGFTYDKYDNNSNLGELIRGRQESPGYPHVSINYKMNDESKEYKDMREVLSTLRAEMSMKQQKEASEEDKKALWAEYYAKRKQLVPPGRFKVAFDFKGGALVPSRIVFDEDSIGLW